MIDTGIITIQKIVSHPLSRRIRVGSACTDDHRLLMSVTTQLGSGRVLVS